MKIHATAIINDGAKIGEGVQIGAYSIIGPEVVIGKNTFIDSHVVIDGKTTIGENNKIFPFTSIGKAPQVIKSFIDKTSLVIGDNNLIRECVTINLGSTNGGGLTKIGSNNMIMAYSHIAHDCEIQNNVVLTNNTGLCGHVIIEDNAIIGGFVGVTQFNRIGKFAYIGGYSVIRNDFPPFFRGKGNDDFKVQAVNTIGLARSGIVKQTIDDIKEAFKIIYMRNLTLDEALKELEILGKESNEVKYLFNFIKNSKGILR